MSTSPFSQTPGLVGYKKRRLQGSCDVCKRKKIRCDSAKMPDRCSNCIAFDLPCTHTSAKRLSGLDPPKPNVGGIPSSAVQQIFVQFRSTRTLMHNLLSSNPLIPKEESVVKQNLLELAVYAHHLEYELQSLLASQQQQQSASTDISQMPLNSEGDSSFISSAIGPKADVYIPSTERSPSPESHDPNDPPRDSGPIPTTSLSAIDKEIDNELAGGFDEMSFTGLLTQSSELMLVKAAMNRADKELEGSGPETLAKREVFWRTQPWCTTTSSPPIYAFPPDDLIWSLIDIYFENINFILPIFHRPTFERQVTEGLHRRHSWFGASVLAVCATASRYSEDPRIFVEDVEPEVKEFSAGYKYFSQIDFSLMVKRFTEEPVTVYELQTCCLGSLYLQGTSLVSMCFSVIGLGMRLAQSVGAHVTRGKLTVERELWRRSFWALILIDTLFAATTGRPRATVPDDYSLDMVAEIDDEYWEDPDEHKAFKQPPGKPSKVSQFVHLLKVFDILGFAQRTVYSVRKSRNRTNEAWVRHVLHQTDSALDKWKADLPEHLKWDPNRHDTVFFNQSALLHACYSITAIQIHVPWVTNVFPVSTIALTSLSRCTRIARFCAEVLHVQSKRGFIPFPMTQLALLISSLILTINIWDGQRSGVGGDAQSDIADIRKCMDVMKTFERRFQVAGRLNDTIGALLRQDEQTRQSVPPVARKRTREEEDTQPEDHLNHPSQNVVAPEEYPSTTPGYPSDYSDIFSIASGVQMHLSHFASNMQPPFMSSVNDQVPNMHLSPGVTHPEYAEVFPDYRNVYEMVFGSVPQMAGEPFSFDFTWPPPSNY